MVNQCRRRRKPKLLTRPTNLEPSLKQPLMNMTDGLSSSQAPAGSFYNCAPPITGTICANNGALSMSPPGYTQLVGMPPAGVSYHNATQVTVTFINIYLLMGDAFKRQPIVTLTSNPPAIKLGHRIDTISRLECQSLISTFLGTNCLVTYQWLSTK